MLFSEIRHNPSAIKRDSLANFSEMRSYILYLNRQGKKDVGNIELSNLGVTIENNLVVIPKIDRQAINKEYFNLPVTVELNISDTDIEKIKKSCDFMEYERERAQQSVSEYRRSLERQNSEVQSTMKNLAIAYGKLRQLEGESGAEQKFADEIKKIVADGYWKYEGMNEDNDLKFMSNNSACIYDLDEGNTKMINLGCIGVLISVKNLSFKFYRGERTVLADGFFHPHISSGGYLCLGNAVASWEEALANLDIHKMMKIAETIITNYNPGNPYVMYSRFEDKIKQNQKDYLRKIDEKEQTKKVEEDLQNSEGSSLYAREYQRITSSNRNSQGEAREQTSTAREPTTEQLTDFIAAMLGGATETPISAARSEHVNTTRLPF